MSQRVVWQINGSARPSAQDLPLLGCNFKSFKFLPRRWSAPAGTKLGCPVGARDHLSWTRSPFSLFSPTLSYIGPSTYVLLLLAYVSPSCRQWSKDAKLTSAARCSKLALALAVTSLLSTLLRFPFQCSMCTASHGRYGSLASCSSSK